MDFNSAKKYLDGLVSYEAMEKAPYKGIDLEKFKSVFERSGVGVEGVKFVHVGGSKGKGTVCGMAAEYLVGIGCKVGLFTSPHLVDVRERVRVDGEMISEVEFGENVEWVRGLGEEMTYFEVLTMVALKYFVDKGCEWVVLEVGLGGRLDSTNIVVPEVSVLTRMEMEHVGILGNNMSEILDEKLGIVKNGVPFVVGEQSDEVMELVKGKLARDVEVHFVEDMGVDLAGLDGLGARYENGRIVYGVLKVLLGDVDKGVFKRVFEGFKMVGRFDVREVSGKTVVFDVAHTVLSMRNLVGELGRRFSGRKFKFLVGFLKGKDVEGMMEVIKGFADEVKVVGVKGERGIEGEDAKEVFRQAVTSDRFDEVVVVTGSTYLVGELI